MIITASLIASMPQAQVLIGQDIDESYLASITTGGATVLTGPSSPGSFYGDDAGPSTPVYMPGSDPLQTGGLGLSINPALPVIAGLIVVTLAMLRNSMGWIAGTAVYAFLRTIMAVGGRITAGAWSAMPSWVKAGLALVGIEEGAEFILSGDTDLDPGDALGSIVGGLGSLFGGGGGAPSSPTHALHGGVAKSWKNDMTGLWGVKYADGWMGAQRKDGTWTVWKPKKPVVIFPGGASDIRDTLRAFKIAGTQIDKVKKASDKLVKTRYRDRCGVCGYVRCRCSK